jgi:hypothetical protein
MEGRAQRALVTVLLGILPLLSLEQGPDSVARAQAGQHPCVFDHSVLRTAPDTCRPHAITYPKKVHGKVRKAIYDSALTFGVPYSILLQIAKCESGLNPKARGYGYYGLFQFAPDTFKEGATELLTMTGIIARSYWKPTDASYVAGFLFAIGKAPAWSCEGQPR